MKNDFHEPGDAKQETENSGTGHHWGSAAKFCGKYSSSLFYIELLIVYIGYWSVKLAEFYYNAF